MPTILSIAGLYSNTSLDGVGYDLSDLLFRNVKVCLLLGDSLLNESIQF